MTENTRKPCVNIITMGCAKNLVDSERLAHMFAGAGVDVVFDADGFTGGDVVINTCGFIGDAKEESIEMILQEASEGFLSWVASPSATARICPRRFRR